MREPRTARGERARQAPTRPRTPPDAAAFLAAAERTTNAYDAKAAAALYAADARLEAVTDGAIARHHGRSDIETAWHVYFSALRARRFHVTKTLTTATSATIVNEWRGTFAGRGHARGIEHWTFDADGLVTEHQMYSFLAVRPEGSRLQRARSFCVYPRLALATLRARG